MNIRTGGTFREVRRRGSALLALALVACTVQPRTDQDRSGQSRASAPHKQIVQPEGVARLPVFSTAVRTGDLLFLSGQIGTMPGVTPPQLVDGGVQAETRQAFENIKTVLGAANLTLDDLVKCTVFLADIADYPAVNEVYVTFFPSDPPARSAIAGSGLALGARVEIECIAAYPEA
ncbi:MAG: RidA family protein [Gemmatimonadota bacterium]|jgi:reactive intermediate/imine deaminase